MEKVDWCFISVKKLNFCVRYQSVSSVAQSLSRVHPFATPWTAAHQPSLSITNSQSLPKLMSIESMMPSSHLILCHPLLLLPPIPQSIRVFFNESTLRMRWPKYWSFSFSIRPSKEHPGLISFRMDWLDLPAVQGILKSLLQYHSSKASVIWLFASGSQNLGASDSISVLPMNIKGWFPLGLAGLISLQSKGFSRVFSRTAIRKHWFFST